MTQSHLAALFRGLRRQRRYCGEKEGKKVGRRDQLRVAELFPLLAPPSDCLEKQFQLPGVLQTIKKLPVIQFPRFFVILKHLATFNCISKQSEGGA